MAGERARLEKEFGFMIGLRNAEKDSQSNRREAIEDLSQAKFIAGHSTRCGYQQFASVILNSLSIISFKNAVG